MGAGANVRVHLLSSDIDCGDPRSKAKRLSTPESRVDTSGSKAGLPRGTSKTQVISSLDI